MSVQLIAGVPILTPYSHFPFFSSPNLERPKKKKQNCKAKTIKIEQILEPERSKSLLSYIIKYTKNYTVGPLDYCGVARRVEGRGEDR